MTIFCIVGLLMYAYFHDCDPLLAGEITKRDQVSTSPLSNRHHYLLGKGAWQRRLFLVALVCLFVCLSVCLSVDNITPKVINGLG